MYKSTIATAIAMAMVGAVNATPAPTNSANADILNVQNRCIVRLNDGVSKFDVDGRARGMVAAAQARGNAQAALQYVYKNSIKGFTINMSCAAAQEAFGDNVDVLSMESDGIVTMMPGPPGGGGGSGSGQTVPWSVTRVGGPVDGSGNTAWVIDTGIDLDHADLNVDASRGFSAFTTGKNAGFDDGNGHGTHVAGTIAALDNGIDVVGVAAGATVVPVKVLDSRGSGTYSGVIAGIDYVGANANAGDCANMSLGGGYSAALNDAVIAASQQSGAYFVLAAGNDGDHANNHSPASANGSRVFTISASDSNDVLASWSNYGNPPVDYAAPGVSILSTKNGGGTTTMSGTSMASPAACAVIMMRNGNPGTDGKVSGDPDGNADSIIHL
ncbi:S8 family serine peptidase [Paraneptunicella aestuarii]|uniref:S8 family serine peptidase n=1 Tax=Paraneptunicella aestuarii TaxID=2831148 RepID=UPI001E5F9435|nr:S8 family serine peptidase [Paraneptunicella aestuarii]UAA40611.1 S8 family serine peptidase [Paraneptunicella aestuarii]